MKNSDCTSTNAMNHILLDGELDVTKKGLKTTFGPSWTDYADDVYIEWLVKKDICLCLAQNNYYIVYKR